ncbi:NUDIX domain-containing protein [Rhizobium mongolense]|uniref:ADP-ribose pyrophosphatase YjhB (NUDIX family) n=2 Tax=Rhizobium mongolense TaxID=57676 RepID=A0A7W6RHA7_9HYPH|nr:NUDIX domain-containing protein [Rhizobium mongolense]MBB4229228.1 ADP-ribose pyrophosphatase YjhB (NUDIX family) [Rhizobium mongolense]MBB4272471.1 ADP-ribose pyrophosphatase YjhB (NUDIX family) [Rhizobium mongolense]TVZ63221.1 ADP-ribose pyrophosphatase YjhB (NUDIX family) [Rhizobium mongolense USDA 1844]
MTTKEIRPWQSKLLMRIVHGYFALARGMTMGVRAACFDSSGRIFLVRHSYIPGWHMPGGGLERNETAEEALIKELREEGNLRIIGKPQLFHVYFNASASRRDHVVFYRAEVEQTAPRKPDREIVECGFFALDGLPDGTTEATRRRLRELSGEEPAAHFW